MNRLLCLACSLVLVTCFQTAAYSAQSEPSLRFLTEDSAPDNFIEQGVLKGVFIDLLDEIWKVMKVPKQTVEVLPWARAYRDVQDIPNTVLFAIARTPEREPLFKWVGPVRTARFVLMANRKTKIWIGSPQELQNYKIGTVMDDIREKLLVDLGIPLSKLDRAPSNARNLEKFKNGRFDLVPMSETGIVTVLKSNGMNPANYRVVYTLSEKQIHFAFNKATPDSVIVEYQQALDTVRKNGTLGKILKKYGIVSLESGSARP